MKKRKLHICANSPICSGTKLEEGEFIKPKNDEEDLIDCHKCSGKNGIEAWQVWKILRMPRMRCHKTINEKR